MRIRAQVALAAVGVFAVASSLAPIPVDAAPVERAGHHNMSWAVTDAAGAPPPIMFGGGKVRPWGGGDRVWTQPGFTGSYRIEFDGVSVAGYCGDFHNAASPDAASEWVVDRTAFVGSDKALTKLSYAHWRWGATTDPDVGAALNLYTHFLGSPGDRSNSSGVPVPDINDNDILDEIVTTRPPHAGVAAIMNAIDAEAEGWSAAFDHRPANVAAGLAIEMNAGARVVTSAATGRSLPSATYDLAVAGRSATATTAGVARPLRDVSAGSQNSITAGVPQTARHDVAPDIEVASQISDVAPSIGSTLSDAITLSGLLDNETATVRVELFDLTVDPTGTASALATEVRSGLSDGSTTGWAPFDVSVAGAGHRWGYRHRLESIEPTPASGVLPGEWSELGIASETGLVDDLVAEVHLRKTVSSSSRPAWINAQRGTEPSHRAAPAPIVAADGSHDDGPPDDGDALPIFVEGDHVSFRYEIWLDNASTGDVRWTEDSDSDSDAGDDGGVEALEMIVDDAGTEELADDFVPTYVDGDNGDGRLSVGEVWVFEFRDQRQAAAGDRHINVASVGPGAIVNPVTLERTGRTTTARADPAGYVVPCLATSVADRSDGDRVLDAGGGIVVDVATYCNLVPGESYAIDGVVVVQSTGEPTAFHGSTTFVPETPDGTVEVEINIEVEEDERVVAGDYVVFETVTSADSGETVAVHADLDDAAQTFTVLASEEELPAVPPTTVPPTTGPPTTVPPTTVPPTTVPGAPPPSAGPPTASSPPSIPKVGGAAAQLALLAGLALFTAGVVLLEARHGRIRRPVMAETMSSSRDR